MKNTNQAPTSKLTGVPGWETELEQRLLKKYAGKVPIGGAILEIGSEYGMSSSIFRKFSFPDVVINCVDINKEAPFMHNLKELGLDWKVYPHYMPSSEFFGWLKEATADIPQTNLQQFDLIFVDGDHSYKGALHDLKGMESFLKPGGFVLIHDCACITNHNPHPSHYEVSQAVTEWWDKAKYTLLETVDSVMVFQKRVLDA